MSYDAQRTAAFYDEYGEREWTRFEDGRTPAASIVTHTHYLQRFVRDGDRVLDAGCGPGRFAIELARLGATVVLADISAGQLEQSRARMAEAGAEHAIEDRVLADVCDLPFEDGGFDATVCFGGALSYVLERAGEAVAELARVTRPGGHLLVSTMSLAGATSQLIDGVLDAARVHGVGAVEHVTATGFLPTELSGHGLEMKLYRWRELRALLEPHGEIVVAAATGLLRTAPEEAELRELAERLEVDLGAEGGMVDAGQHILAVLRA